MYLNNLFLFLDVSGGELMLIVLVVFLVFGPQKMPEIARKLGRAINEMKKASNDLTREFRQETSGIRSEIAAAQNKLKDEINNVKQEVTQTRARVTSNLSVSAEMENPVPEKENTPAPVVPAEDSNAEPGKSE
jgi:TatA/E family protein of Tat protein translocase